MPLEQLGQIDYRVQKKKLKPDKELKQQRGSYALATSSENVTITKWFDNSSIILV